MRADTNRTETHSSLGIVRLHHRERGYKGHGTHLVVGAMVAEELIIGTRLLESINMRGGRGSYEEWDNID